MATLMVWALLALDDSARHITEVKSGLECGCLCPGCRAMLEAVNSENPSWKRRPHFRHHKTHELESCTDAAVLTGAKSCFAELNEIMLPGETFVGTAKCINGQTVTEKIQLEPTVVKVRSYEFVDATDAILTLADGQQVYVRLIAQGASIQSHTPKQGPLAEIIIDISDPVLKTADRETMRGHISLSAKHRIWCKNQRWALWEAEAGLRAHQRASERNQQVERERNTQQTPPRTSRSGVPREFIWAASVPSKSARRARQLQIAIQHYRNSGGFAPPVSTLPFERILEEAEIQRTSGSQLVRVLENWDAKYQLGGNRSPLVNVLLVAGLVEARVVSSDSVSEAAVKTNPPSAVDVRIENLKRLLGRN